MINLSFLRNKGKHKFRLHEWSKRILETLGIPSTQVPNEGYLIFFKADTTGSIWFSTEDFNGVRYPNFIIDLDRLNKAFIFEKESFSVNNLVRPI